MLESTSMKIFDVSIVGAGVMGLAAACELAREGASIVVIDQASIPNPRAASIDHSKVFRFAYPDPFYVKLAVDALKGWRSLENETGASLLTQTGMVVIGKSSTSHETEYHAALRAEGVETQLLQSSEVVARYPQFNAHAFVCGIFDPSGAITYAETAVRNFLALAKRRGVATIENERVAKIEQRSPAGVSLITESGDEIASTRAMIASGPWTREVLPI